MSEKPLTAFQEDQQIIAALRAKLAEAEREANRHTAGPNSDAGMYLRTLRDLHAMTGRSGEPTTHGLDYTTALSARIRAAEASNRALREALGKVANGQHVINGSGGPDYFVCAMCHPNYDDPDSHRPYCVVGIALRGALADQGAGGGVK